jgi:hypothetical protein
MAYQRSGRLRTIHANEPILKHNHDRQLETAGSFGSFVSVAGPNHITFTRSFSLALSMLFAPFSLVRCSFSSKLCVQAYLGMILAPKCGSVWILSTKWVIQRHPSPMSKDAEPANHDAAAGWGTNLLVRIVPLFLLVTVG